jgi:hypothetical protein
MPLKEANFSKGNDKNSLICINVNNEIKYISLMDAAEMAKSIITQIQIIGLQNVSHAGEGKHKEDITRKTGSCT